MSVTLGIGGKAGFDAVVIGGGIAGRLTGTVTAKFKDDGDGVIRLNEMAKGFTFSPSISYDVSIYGHFLWWSGSKTIAKGTFAL